MSRHPHLLVLANQSVLWRKLLARLLTHAPGMLVVDDSGDFHELPGLFRQVRIDWLVVTWQAERGIPDQARVLAQREPSLSLLALAVDGSYAEIHFKTLTGEHHRLHCQSFTLPQLLTILRYKPGDAFPYHEPGTLSTLLLYTDPAPRIRQSTVRKARVV